MGSALSKYLNQRSSILEVGCGDGSRIAYLADKFSCKGFGLDLSSKAIENGQKRYPFVELSCGNASSLPFKTKQFDFVFLGFILYLIKRENYLKVLSEADRVLADHGFLCILDFDVPGFYSNVYLPNPALKSFKMDNSKVFTSSGLYTLIDKVTFQHGSECFAKNVDDRISFQILHKENTF